MPAPKTPSTSAATVAAALAAKKRREAKAAEMLRAAGWTVTRPDETKEPS